MGKKVLIILLIIIAILIVTGGILYYTYLYSSGEIIEIKLPESERISPSSTSAPTEDSIPVEYSSPTKECSSIIDSYTFPDFDALKEKLSTNQMVKDTPGESKIVLTLYHVLDGCKIWDKAYLLRDGTIEEKNIIADVEMEIDSDYVDKLIDNDLCQVIDEARTNGDLREKVNMETSKLLWRYKSMISHRECLGV